MIAYCFVGLFNKQPKFVHWVYIPICRCASHKKRTSFSSFSFFLAGKLLTVELYKTKSCLYSPHIPRKINSCRNAKKKNALPVKPSSAGPWGHHEVAIFFILSNLILSSETSTGGLLAADSGFGTVGIFMSSCKKKKTKKSIKRTKWQWLCRICTVYVCTKTKSSEKTHSTLAYT